MPSCAQSIYLYVSVSVNMFLTFQYRLICFDFIVAVVVFTVEIKANSVLNNLSILQLLFSLFLLYLLLYMLLLLILFIALLLQQPPLSSTLNRTEQQQHKTHSHSKFFYTNNYTNTFTHFINTTLSDIHCIHIRTYSPKYLPF